MATYLDLKNEVANNLGKTDGATYNTKRESAINRARRKFYQEKEWSFLRKVGTTITLTNQIGSLPSDYCDKFNPASVYTYTGNLKYEYRQVEWSDLTSYNTMDWVYALDPFNSQIQVSQAVASVLIDYQYLPADKTATDGSQDTNVEPAPDITPIALLATAYYFMASRQSKASYSLFLQDYRIELTGASKADHDTDVPLLFRKYAPRIDRGYYP